MISPQQTVTHRDGCRDEEPDIEQLDRSDEGWSLNVLDRWMAGQDETDLPCPGQGDQLRAGQQDAGDGSRERRGWRDGIARAESRPRGGDRDTPCHQPGIEREKGSTLPS